MQKHAGATPAETALERLCRIQKEFSRSCDSATVLGSSIRTDCHLQQCQNCHLVCAQPQSHKVPQSLHMSTNFEKHECTCTLKNGGRKIQRQGARASLITWWPILARTITRPNSSSTATAPPSSFAPLITISRSCCRQQQCGCGCGWGWGGTGGRGGHA